MPGFDDLFMGVPGTSGVDHTDPIEVLKAIAAPAPVAAPPVGRGTPMSPIAPPPTSGGPAQPSRWKALLDLVGPLSGFIASGDPIGRAAFTRGWQELEQRHAKDRQQKAEASAKFLMEVGQHAMTLTDPTQLEQFKGLAKEAGEKLGWDVRGIDRIQFNPNQFSMAQRAELTRQITALQDRLPEGTSIDQIDGTVPDGTGRQVPIHVASRAVLPLDKAGNPIPPPKKIDTTQRSEEERDIAAWAKEQGITYSAVPRAKRLELRAEFRAAGRAESKPPSVAPGGVDAQFQDLVALWKEGHPGEEPPAAVRTKLRKQANDVNDRPAPLGGMNNLYSQVDPGAIAAQIRAGDHPPDVSIYGRPVAAAVASVLAKPGPNGEPPFKLSDAMREWRAQLNLNRTMNGSQQVRLDESIRSGLAMYDKIDDLAGQWNGKGWGVLSRANLAAAREGAKGPKAQAIAIQLTGQIAQLTSDVATIEQGGLTPTNESRAIAEKSLQDWWGVAGIKAMTAQGRYNMQIRHLARNTQDTMTPGNGADLSPAKPATPGPTVGETRTYNGETRRWNGSIWELVR